MKLAALLEGLEGVTVVRGSPALEVAAIRDDSRAVRAGDLFVAVAGTAHDGRRFISDAAAHGAAVLVAAEDEPSFPGTVVLARNPRWTLGELAARFDGSAAALTLSAVTGTNGKTTTTYLLEAMLEAAGRRAGVIGTIAYRLRGGAGPALTRPAPLTTPNAVLLHETFREMRAAGAQDLVLEASSIALEQGRLAGCRFRVAGFTNLTQDHLDYHGSMDAYWQAKAELFRWPGLRAAVINIDDTHGASLCANLIDAGIGALDVWTVSAGGKPARLMARDIGYDAQGLQFSVAEHGTAAVERLSTGLIGQYNVSNLLGVLGTLRALGLTLAQAVAACANLTSVPGRMDRAGSGEGAPLAVVDYAHTPDALDKALIGLRPLAKQRGGALWCLFGCGGDRDPIKRPMMAAVAERQADRVIVTSDNPRSEKPDAIISQVLRGFSRPDAARVQPDRAAAIADAIAQAAPQDVVLIAGKGHEAWQEIAGQRIEFSDKAHALQALAKRGGAA